jgi:hypothetical protein
MHDGFFVHGWNEFQPKEHRHFLICNRSSVPTHPHFTLFSDKKWLKSGTTAAVLKMHLATPDLSFSFP